MPPMPAIARISNRSERRCPADHCVRAPSPVTTSDKGAGVAAPPAESSEPGVTEPGDRARPDTCVVPRSVPSAFSSRDLSVFMDRRGVFLRVSEFRRTPRQRLSARGGLGPNFACDKGTPQCLRSPHPANRGKIRWHVPARAGFFELLPRLDPLQDSLILDPPPRQTRLLLASVARLVA